jgi:hypothetical protein
LDDLLEDFFASGKDDLKAYGIESKHGSKGYNSDDEDKKVKEKEIKFRKFVEEYEEQVVFKQTSVHKTFTFSMYIPVSKILLNLQSKELNAGDDVPQWGQRVFGCQVKWPYIYSVNVECDS